MGVGGLYRQPAAIGHGVAGIDAEIENDVFELVRIDIDIPQSPAKHGFQPHLSAQRMAQQVRHFADQPIGIDDFRPQRLLT